MFPTARLVERIREEYVAMPGLKLTREQACRLWGVGHETCMAALDALLAEGFLHQTGTGKFVALPRPSGASLAIEAARAATTSALRCPHCGKRNSVELEQTTTGHNMVQTVRCVACQRIISFAQRTA
jgi:phage FluMu protein Com